MRLPSACPADQAGLHHPAAAQPGHCGAGQSQGYKALRDQLAAVLGELRRMEAGGGVDDELLATIRLITMTLDGMKED